VAQHTAGLTRTNQNQRSSTLHFHHGAPIGSFRLAPKECDRELPSQCLPPGRLLRSKRWRCRQRRPASAVASVATAPVPTAPDATVARLATAPTPIVEKLSKPVPAGRTYPRPTKVARASSLTVSPVTSPAPSPATSPATLEIEVEHKFAEANLSIWVDDRLTYTHRFGRDRQEASGRVPPCPGP
jgi:hypothetical protein